MIITIWKKFSIEKKGMIFSHLSYGFSYSELLPCCDPFGKNIWISEKACMIDSKVVMA